MVVCPHGAAMVLMLFHKEHKMDLNSCCNAVIVVILYYIYHCCLLVIETFYLFIYLFLPQTLIKYGIQ